MPYKIMHTGDEWCVHKEDGKKIGCHDSEAGAKRQMAALHANEKKSIGEKRLMKYEQEEVHYAALSMEAGQACANCRWFSGSGAEYPNCNLIVSWPADIEPTGWCNQWAALPNLKPEPMQVEIVDDGKSAKSISDIKLEMHRKFNLLLDELDALELVAGEGEPVESPPPEPEKALDGDHDDPEPQTIYAAPDSNDPGLLKAITDKFKRGLKPGQSTFKAADGQRYMFITTSNSYADREDETLTTEALKSDVDRHWTGEDAEFMSNNPLLFWHDDDIPLGDVVWADMIGPFYVEVAREREKALFRLARAASR